MPSRVERVAATEAPAVMEAEVTVAAQVAAMVVAVRAEATEAAVKEEKLAVVEATQWAI